MLNKNLIKWIQAQKSINKIKLEKKNKNELDQWIFSDRSIYHKKKIFFLIKPFIFRQIKSSRYL